MVDKVTEDELGLHRPVVRLKGLESWLGDGLPVDLGKDELLVHRVDVDIEVPELLALDVDDHLGESLAAELLGIGFEGGVVADLVGEDVVAGQRSRRDLRIPDGQRLGPTGGWGRNAHETHRQRYEANPAPVISHSYDPET